MLHPVLPPTPPSISEPLQSLNVVASHEDVKLNSVVEQETGRQESQNLSQQESKQAQFPNAKTKVNAHRPLPTTVRASGNQLVVSQALSKPNTPETFPPEFSPLSSTQSAALLGQPLAVGYAVDRDAATPSRKAVIATSPDALVSQILPSSQTSRVIEQGQLSDIKTIKYTDRDNSASSASQNGAISQSVQNVIEFTSRNSTNAQTTPSTVEFKPQAQQNLAPNSSGNPSDQQNLPPSNTPPSNTLPVRERIVEVISDKQVFDDKRRIVTAEGNVVVRFDGAVVDADRIQVNLDNLIAVGEGNVALTRGDQVLRGERFTYNFIQDSGQLLNGRGEIYLPTADKDVTFLATDVTAGGVPQRPISDRIRANQPVTNVSSPGAIEFTVGGTADASNLPPPKSGGAVNRLRFEADQIDFYPRGWQAKEVRITNDPFSPPELQLRAAEVTLTREAPLIDRVRGQNSRLVFDNKFALGIPRNQQKIDRRQREVTPAIVSVGFDGDLRGGLFIERGFELVDTERTSLRVTPQFFVQKAVQDGNTNVASLFGVKTRLNMVLNSKADIQGNGELTSLDLSKVEDNLKGSLRYRQRLGDVNPHLLNLEYSYRDRLYNGTLGFQTVQSSLGGVLLSPVIPLGNSGINLTYQAGAQLIEANTDRLDLLEPNRTNDRISLGRIQGSAALSSGVLLWQGKPLPATPSEGLRYSPNPVVPYLRAIAGITGTTSYYSNGDNQSTLIGTVGLEGQIGNFSRDYLDYTAFNVRYSQGLNSGLSPFLFDRSVDNKVLSAGITQQIYGPFRVGFQTSVNLDTGRESSTDYIVEYNRRTYGLTLRYNPVLQLGGFSIRISDFNWSGGSDPFSDQQVKPVVGGVRQEH